MKRMPCLTGVVVEAIGRDVGAYVFVLLWLWREQLTLEGAARRISALYGGY